MQARRLTRLAGALIAALMLAGCAATGGPAPPSDRFEAGREAWKAGDYSLAFELMLAEADAGNADAQYTVGYMYYLGQGVQQDERAAIRWIQRAASNGSERAMQALGELAAIGARYQRGQDAPEDTEGVFEQQPRERP